MATIIGTSGNDYADGSGHGAAQLIASVFVWDENFEQGALRASDVIIV